ncbi:hypothetical protein GCM10017556_21810 [Micromonospora sagamiensis]|nr:hypothetical protein GCM10017556_21810 [Micromonospora sagamiensis]
MHGLAGDSKPFGDVRDRRPGKHVLDGPVPLFHHAYLHQHSAECHPGPDTDLSRRSRDRTGGYRPVWEDFLYIYQGGPERAARAAARARARRSAGASLLSRRTPGGWRGGG